MKKINDSKLYLYASIITLSVGIILGIIFLYSSLLVEPEIKKLISFEKNINNNYKEAYLKLKNPQLFARYENFDRVARPVKTIIKAYDKKIEEQEVFEEKDKMYLQILLDRRQQGAELTRNTMFFFFILSALGILFYLFELKQNKKYA